MTPKHPGPHPTIATAANKKQKTATRDKPEENTMTPKWSNTPTLRRRNELRGKNKYRMSIAQTTGTMIMSGTPGKHLNGALGPPRTSLTPMAR